ncbi:MAG: hypothetical protein NUV91_07675 [Candidatus Omnitrophica bacterium]|nr:hypothetical protein [Candidatus Omnitrophota bacterium]
MNGKTILKTVSTFFVLGMMIFLFIKNQILFAKFNIDALYRYVEAMYVIENRPIRDLKELPDFELISPSNGFRLKGQNLRDGVENGYIYHMELQEENGLIISASPRFSFFPQVEFGMTPDGTLHLNTKAVDATADSFKEIQSWPITPRIEDIRTEKLPAYLKKS